MACWVVSFAGERALAACCCPLWLLPPGKPVTQRHFSEPLLSVKGIDQTVKRRTVWTNPKHLASPSAGVDVPAVEADGERQVRARAVLPVPWAALDERRLLRPQLVFQPLRRRLDVAPERHGMQTSSERQEFAEQAGAKAVGDQAANL